MKNAYWVCPLCNFKANVYEKYFWRCPKCGSALRIDYHYEFEPKGYGLNRYASMFPFIPAKTAGEGATPSIVELIAGNEIIFKLEYLNPSGSFKDRGTCLAIHYAHQLGFKKVVEDTSGNTGISVALYARKYNLKATIVMPRYAPYGKKTLIKLLGGEVVETPTRGDASRKVLEYTDMFYVAHIWNPLYIIGASTIAYEVFEQEGVPDYIITPIGSGGLFLGLIEGFEKLYELGVVDKVPTPIGVQGYSVQPVYEELYGKSLKGENSDLADGILVPNPPRKKEIAEKIKRYNGRVVLVGNSDIIRAWKELFEKGYIVEPTSAAPFAGYFKVLDRIGPGKTILIPLTGSGLKTLDIASKLLTSRG